MRISDWSSDVCSSDLAEAENGSDEDVAKACGVAPVIEAHREQRTGTGYCEDYTVPKVVVELLRRAPPDQGGEIERGEEHRRFADQQECERPCKIVQIGRAHV